jgi:hypothetical protein
MAPTKAPRSEIGLLVVNWCSSSSTLVINIYPTTTAFPHRIPCVKENDHRGLGDVEDGNSLNPPAIPVSASASLMRFAAHFTPSF